jgi:acetolactate synthase-1/2/3 large subunit
VVDGEAVALRGNGIADFNALHSRGTPIHPLRLVHELQQFVGSDTTVCLNMGSFHLWIARRGRSTRKVP